MEVSEPVRVLILAVLQGIAEFLPISSSGHILVGARLLGDVKEILELSIVLHFGTLLSILVFYRQKILRIPKRPSSHTVADHRNDARDMRGVAG